MGETRVVLISLTNLGLVFEDVSCEGCAHWRHDTMERRELGLSWSRCGRLHINTEPDFSCKFWAAREKKK